MKNSIKIIYKENLIDDIDDGTFLLKKNEKYYIVESNYSFHEKYTIFDRSYRSCLCLADDCDKDQILSEYFYTKQECRKLKLIQLNEK